MVTIGLIRHGVTEWNILGKAQGITNIPLNNLGRKQAGKLGARMLEDMSWDMIITSDLARAIETGIIIGNKINLVISHYDTRIREINCGCIEGTTEG